MTFCFPGAALGRVLGEAVAYVSLTGVTSGQQQASINPGGYALAGKTIGLLMHLCLNGL